jgi:chromosome segregation ATPase
MAQKGPPLQKLVALKRQRAEQNLLSVQQELTALKTDLQRLETDLTSLNGEAGGIEAHILSYEHGYAQRQTLAIQACRAKITEKEAEFAAAREALKRAFDSEQRLRRESGRS